MATPTTRKKNARATQKTTSTKKIQAAAPKKKVEKKLVTTPVAEAFNKSQVLNHVAEETGLKRTAVSDVLDSLSHLIHRHLKKRGAGEFTVPGLMKCKVVRKPATKARKGINPFTGEETTFKAKPARNVVKIRPLKKLKEMAE